MPTTFEDELRSALDRLGEYAPSGPVPDLSGRAGKTARQRSVVVSGAVIAAVAVVVATVWALQSNPRHQTVVGAAPGVIAALPPAPMAARSDMASAWTGHQWLIWGGSNGRRWFANGAAFDPTTNRWSVLPPAPLKARIDPVSVWTGQLWLIWGGTSGTTSFRDGASYDPSTRTWQVLSPAPAALPADGNIAPAGVWTGTELIIVTSTGNAAAYQPSTLQWLHVAVPPGAAAIPEPHALWTGSEAIFLLGNHPSVGSGLNGSGAQTPPTRVTSSSGSVTPSAGTPGTTTSSPPAVPPGVAAEQGPPFNFSLAAYDPNTNRWSELPTGGMQPGTEPDLVWTGRLLLTLNPTPEQTAEQTNSPHPGFHRITVPAGINAAYDPATLEWTSLPAIPASVEDPGPLFTLSVAPPVWTGTSVLLWAGGARGLSYTPATASWSEIPAGGGPTRQRQVTGWTGADLLGWGGSNVANARQVLNTGVRYRPPE